MPELEWLETARANLLAIVDYISDDNPTPRKDRKTISRPKPRSYRSIPDFIGPAGSRLHMFTPQIERPASPLDA